MNVGVILVVIVALAVTMIGIIGISSYHSAPVVDTLGHTYDNQTNQSIAAGQGVTTTTAEFGGWGVVIAAVIFVCATMVAVLGLILYRGGVYTSTRR